MSRNVHFVLLCEDTQHDTFVRRFLDKLGWSTRRLRVVKAPPGRGAAEQFVREHFPVELSSYRSRRGQVGQALLVMLDGDDRGVKTRLDTLVEACRSKQIQPREDGDRVAIFVPTWRIETWFAYLDGESIDEGRDDYPRLRRPRDCQKYVDVLVHMCRERKLREPAPPSLVAACDEYRARLAVWSP